MIPLYKPYMPDELPCLEEILHSGALAYGKWGRSFEDALQKYLHCLYSFFHFKFPPNYWLIFVFALFYAKSAWFDVCVST